MLNTEILLTPALRYTLRLKVTFGLSIFPYTDPVKSKENFIKND